MTTDRQRLQQTLLARKTKFDIVIKKHPDWTREFKLAYWEQFLASVQTDAHELKHMDDIAIHNRLLEEALEFERTNKRTLQGMAS